MNSNLRAQINETEAKYQELRRKKIEDIASDSMFTESALIKEEFEWMNSKEEASITLENADKKVVDLKDYSPLNSLILEELSSRMINPMPGFVLNYNYFDIHYTLKYIFKDRVYEILIFNDGIIKSNGNLYHSSELLSLAQALMPIVVETSVQFDEALEVMFSSTAATCSTYSESDPEEVKSVMLDGLSSDYASRLRTSAYFIKQNMIKVNKNIEASGNMSVTKSIGYRDGEEVQLFVFVNSGELHHVKLIYKDTEEIYELKPELAEDPKIKVFSNIWTAN